MESVPFTSQKLPKNPSFKVQTLMHSPILTACVTVPVTNQTGPIASIRWRPPPPTPPCNSNPQIRTRHDSRHFPQITIIYFYDTSDKRGSFKCRVNIYIVHEILWVQTPMHTTLFFLMSQNPHCYKEAFRNPISGD